MTYLQFDAACRHQLVCSTVDLVWSDVRFGAIFPWVACAKRQPYTSVLLVEDNVGWTRSHEKLGISVDARQP